MVDISNILNTFSDNILSLNETSYNLNKLCNGISHLYISTFTMVFDLGCSINIESLTKNFVSTTYPVCKIKKAKTNKDCTYTKRGKIKKSFYNQTTITYKNHTTKSIKVFTNGKLQITGLTNMHEAIETIKVVCSILHHSENAIFSGKPSVDTLKSLSIEMVNSNFNYFKELDLKKFYEILKVEDMSVEYEPDTYPGIKCKRNGISIFIFGTGNVVITGAKSIQALRNTYDYIANIIHECKNVHLKKGKGLKLKKNVLQSKIHGYCENEYNSCVKAH